VLYHEAFLDANWYELIYKKLLYIINDENISKIKNYLSKNLKNDNFILKRNIKMEMNLYNLPKDMLVKMVTEIQNDIKKDTEKEIEILKKKLELVNYLGEYFSCHQYECENFYIIDKSDKIQGDAYYCYMCMFIFCKNHIKICNFCSQKICKNCYENHFSKCNSCGENYCNKHFIRCNTCRIYICKNDAPTCKFCLDSLS